MHRNSPWFLPVAIAAACIPCLLIPVVAALLAGGVLGGALGFLGVPWVVALLSALVAGGALVYLRLRRRPPAC